MNGEKGQALPLAMLALTIGALMIAPFLGHAGASVIGSRTYAEAIALRNSCDAGVEHAIWSLTRGTLAALLPNPGDHITYQLGETLNGVNTTVTVTTNATGGGAVGSISNAIIDTLEFDTSDGYTPVIIQVSDTVLAIAYRGSSNRGYLETVSVASNGDIGNSAIDTLTFETSNCYAPGIIQVADGIYAIAYRSSSNRGDLKTVSIAANGDIGNSVISTLTFETSTCQEPDIIQVAGNTFAIAYRGSSTRGYLITVSIAANGVIGGSVISTLIFDASTCYDSDITQVAGNIFAIAYRGPSNDGYLKTVSIAANGIIGGSVISTFIFDASTGYEPDIIQAASNTFAIAYRNSGNQGYLKTVSIASDGTISPTVVDTLNFETSNCLEPSMLHVSGNIFAIVYRGPSNDGFLITVGISPGGTSAYRIVSTAGGTTISALVNTDNTTASIVSWQIQ